MAITSPCLKIWLKRLWKCWVRWSVPLPAAGGREITSSSRDLQSWGEEGGSSVDPPLLLRQPCSGSWKPGNALTTSSTPERKGTLPASKWEHLEIAKAFRVQVPLIQLWHAAVTDYSAVRLLPLQRGAEGSFVKQITGSISRYHDLFV